MLQNSAPPSEFADAGVAQAQAVIQQIGGRDHACAPLTSPRGTTSFPLRVCTSHSKAECTQAIEEGPGPHACHPGAARPGQNKDKELRSGTGPFKRRGGNLGTHVRTPHCLLKQVRFCPYHIWLRQSRWAMCTIFRKWVLGCCWYNLILGTVT